MNLYEIEQEILDCMEEVDEETGELLNWKKLDSLIVEKEKKIESLACWIKNLAAESEALKKEKDTFMKRQQAAENKKEQLKKYLSSALCGQKFKTSRVSISWRKSKSVEIIDLYAVSKDYLKCSEPVVDKTAVKKAVSNGKTVNGVRIVEKQNIQIS